MDETILVNLARAALDGMRMSRKTTKLREAAQKLTHYYTGCGHAYQDLFYKIESHLKDPKNKREMLEEHNEIVNTWERLQDPTIVTIMNNPVPFDHNMHHQTVPVQSITT